MERGHDGKTIFLVDPAQEREHGVGEGGVEAGHGLVGEQHLGLLYQRAGDRDALLLPAGQRVDAPIAEPGQPHALEDGPGARHVGGGKQSEQRAQHRQPGKPSDEDVVQDAQAPEQIELLEDEADARPDPAEVLGDGSADPRVPDPDLTRRRRHQAVETAQKGGLPRPAGPDEGDHLAVADVQVYAVEPNGVAGINLSKPADVNHPRRPAVRWKCRW